MPKQSRIPQQSAKLTDKQVAASARRWVTLLASDTVTEADKMAFEAWRRTDPAHEMAYQEADRIWSGLPQIPGLQTLLDEQPGPLARVTGFFQWLYAPLQNRPVMAGAAVAGLVVVASVVFFNSAFFGFQSIQPPAIYSYATPVGEIRDIRLPDGSLVSLSAQSAVRAEYSAEGRRVLLEQGEALFTVVSEPQRPFVVIARNAEAKVLGTVFSVRRGLSDIFIAVKAGLVRVTPQANTGQSLSAGGAQAQELVASQGINVMRNGQLGKVRTVSANTVGAWRSGRLYYQEAPLSEVVADANRFFKGEIIIGSSAIANMQVTAAFSTEAIDQLIENITYLLPVRADWVGQGKIILVPANKES